MMERKIILASASPRRRELLAGLGVEFTVDTRNSFEEIAPDGLPYTQYPEYMAKGKSYGFHRDLLPDEIIITADTMVLCSDEIMGKPKDKADAFRMLDMISDDCHQVYTGVTIIRTGEQAEVITFAEKTDVYLYPISEADINAYIESGDPMDKAGAYGIQGDFAVHVKGIAGDYYNVVGLPIGRVYQELKKMM